MFRRVFVPMGWVIGVAVVLFAVNALTSTVERRALDLLGEGAGAWMLPVVPRTEWVVFLTVFLSVRLCHLRGGSRRECLAVGLMLVVLTVAFGLFLLWQMGLRTLPAVFGSMALVEDHWVTLGSVLAVRDYAASLLGTAGTCLAATWLYFFVTRHMPERAGEAAG